MKFLKSPSMLAVAVIICIASSSTAQESNPNTEARLTNGQVLELVKAGIGAETIVEKIKRSRCNFDTDPSQLAELKYKGVPDQVLRAMIEAPYGKPSVVEEPEAASAPRKETRPESPITHLETANANVSTGSLAIQAGIVYRYGAPQPVARTEFVILDDDPEAIITGAGIQGKKTWAMPRMSLMQSFLFMHQGGNWYDGERALASLKPHVIAGGTTDFNGNLVLTELPAKRLYIFGMTQTRGGWAIWNVWVEVKAGQLQNAILDQNNAAISY